MQFTGQPWQMVQLAEQPQPASPAAPEFMPPSGEPPRPEPPRPEPPHPEPPRPEPPRPEPPRPEPPRPEPPRPEPPRPEPPRPEPPRPEPPRPQPPRPEPPRPEPPRPEPPRPEPPRPQPPRPPHLIIPPVGMLPPLGIQPPFGQVLGRGSCLGPASIGYAPQIEAFIDQTMTLRQSFLQLASANRRWGNALQAVADSFLSQARRLAAAYYMVRGRIYWPVSLPAISSRGTFPVELQRLRSITQEQENSYRTAAEESGDRCLAALYSLLADELVVLLGQLQGILNSYETYR